MRLSLLTFLLFFFSGVAQAQTGPIVLELFTSQSCSSCPPADKVLSELAQNKNVIALSHHVTYWNHLHWKDTLSTEVSTQRQRNYAAAFRSRRVYTPQLVINGTEDIVGSRKNAILKRIENTTPLTPVVIQNTDNQLTANLPDFKTGHYYIELIEFGGEHTQSIPSGENRGRTVTYTNPVIAMTSLGSWDGKGQEITLSTTRERGKGMAILIHEKNKNGPIIAAGQYLF